MRVDFMVRHTTKSSLPNGFFIQMVEKPQHERVSDFSIGQSIRERSLSVDLLSSPERKSLRRSTFFKYPPGTCSQENIARNFYRDGRRDSNSWRMIPLESPFSKIFIIKCLYNIFNVSVMLNYNFDISKYFSILETFKYKKHIGSIILFFFMLK